MHFLLISNFRETSTPAHIYFLLFQSWLILWYRSTAHWVLFCHVAYSFSGYGIFGFLNRFCRIQVSASNSLCILESMFCWFVGDPVNVQFKSDKMLSSPLKSNVDFSIKKQWHYFVALFPGLFPGLWPSCLHTLQRATFLQYLKVWSLA